MTLEGAANRAFQELATGRETPLTVFVSDGNVVDLASSDTRARVASMLAVAACRESVTAGLNPARFLDACRQTLDDLHADPDLELTALDPASGPSEDEMRAVRDASPDDPPIQVTPETAAAMMGGKRTIVDATLTVDGLVQARVHPALGFDGGVGMLVNALRDLYPGAFTE